MGGWAGGTPRTPCPLHAVGGASLSTAVLFATPTATALCSAGGRLLVRWLVFRPCSTRRERGERRGAWGAGGRGGGGVPGAVAVLLRHTPEAAAQLAESRRGGVTASEAQNHFSFPVVASRPCGGWARGREGGVGGCRVCMFSLATVSSSYPPFPTPLFILLVVPVFIPRAPSFRQVGSSGSGSGGGGA